MIYQMRNNPRLGAWIMLALIAFVFLLLATTSCVTQRACDRKFPAQEKQIVKDSIIYKEKIVLHDTTIFVPGEKIIIRDNAYCDSLGRAELPKTVIHSGHMTATVSIKDNKVSVDCAEDSLMSVTVKLKDKIVNLEKYHSKEVVKIKTEYKTHWYHKWAMWLSLIFIIYLLFQLYKILKPYFPWLRVV